MQDQLQTIATAAAGGGHLGEMAGTMLDLIQRTAPLESTYLTRIEHWHGRQRILFARHRGEPLVREGETVAWDDTICARALASGELSVPDVTARWPDCESAHQRGIKTYIGSPVFTEEGETFGTLCGISRTADALQGEELKQVLELFARLLSHQIQREAQADKARQRAEYAEQLATEMAFLHRIGDICLNAPALGPAVTEVARLTNERGNWDRAIPFYRDQGVARAGWSEESEIVSSIEPMLAEQATTDGADASGVHGQLMVLDGSCAGVHALRTAAGYGSDGTTALIAVRTATGLQGGVLLLDRGVTALRDGEARLLTNCSNYLSLLAERLEYVEDLRQANRELSQTATHDALTGLRNRRYLIDELGRVVAQAQRLGETVHVAFIDLDGFKAINDQHGHEAGDQLLVAVAERLVAVTRASDIVARYGGDEFVVIGPASDTLGVRYGRNRLAARLSEAVAGHYELPSVSLDYDGASIGVITVAEGETDPDRILARADAAMYTIKERRRHNFPDNPLVG